jgi:hypothetical protein
VFIFTTRLRPGRILLGAAAVVLVCGAVILATGLAGTFGAQEASAASPKGIKTNEDRVAYLESFGWKVNPTAIAVEELLIPSEFDDTYDEYLALQTSQGFDLTRYKGKKVKRYAYEITNYPTGEQGVQAGLLI